MRTVTRYFQGTRATLLASLAGALMLTPVGRAQPPRPGKEDVAIIEKAWKARQARFKSVDMKWVSQETYIKGGVSANYLPPNTPSAKIHPDRDTTFEIPAEFSLDGNKARFGYSGWKYHLVEGRFISIKFVTAYDGRLTRECYPERAGNDSFPTGAVLLKGAFAAAQGIELRPVVLFFRPLEPEFFGLDLKSDFQVVNTSARAQGVNCLELQHRVPNLTWHLWVDPARDYLVLKQVLMERGVVRLQITIRYRHDPVVGWVPEGWETAQMGRDGSVYHSNQVSVTDLIAGGIPPAKQFTPDFPVGTYVRDEVERRQWIVRPDGTNRAITHAERRMSYEAILQSDEESRAKAAWWFKRLCLLVGILCLGFLLWRIARAIRSRAGGQPTAA